MSRPGSSAPRAPASAPVIAIVNSNDDLVGLLRDELVRFGFSVVTAHIRDFKARLESFGTFLTTHNPHVIVYDISVPYEENWASFQTICKLPEARSRHWVVTTVNKRVLEERVGPTGAIEIQGGRADDLDPVLDAVQKVARPSR